MIYRVKDEYKNDTNTGNEFFITGELFEGVYEDGDANSIVSTTPTGATKERGWVINTRNIDIIAKTWKEAREKYPEEFL